MMRKKIPKITNQEKKGMRLLSEMLDMHIDYTTGKATRKYNEEEKQLMDIGWRRHCLEEGVDLNDKQDT